MSEEEPIFEDALFHQKRKHGTWRVVEAPELEGPVADTHAHLQMMRDPALSLARAGAHNVGFVETIVDPSDDGFITFDALPGWLTEAAGDLRRITCEPDQAVHERVVAVPRVRIAARAGHLPDRACSPWRYGGARPRRCAPAARPPHARAPPDRARR